MALNLNLGAQNYTGEVLEDLLTYLAQENETYKEGLIHIKAGIQKRYALPSIQLGTIIQDRVPTPASTNSLGNYTFAERYLEPADFMVYMEFNPRDFEQYYKFAQPVNNLVFRELDPKIQATMLRLLLERKTEYINHAIWCSATATTAANITAVNTGDKPGGNDAAGPMKYFDGVIARILKNAAADASSTDTAEAEDAKCGKAVITGNTAFANGQAVETELYNINDATPAKNRKSAGRVFLMDYNTWDMYNKYLASQSFKYTDNTRENSLMFQGKRIIPMVALPKDTIISGVFTSDVNSNLWMGVDYVNDEEVVRVDRLQNNSELYFFKMLPKMDVNIVKPAEIVAHLPFTYGN